MKISDIRIGRRLYLGFALVILLMACHVVVTHYSMESNYRVLSKIIMEDNRKLEIVGDLNNVVFTEAITIRDSIILTKRPSIEEKLRIIAEGREHFRKIKDQLGNFYDPGEALFFEKIFAVYHAMEPITKRIGTLAEENRDEEALQLLIKERLPLQKELTGTIGQLTGHIRAKQAADLSRQTALRERKRIFDLAVGILVVLSSAFLATFIGRSISNPLLDLAEESRKISSGTHDVSLPTQRKDEIGIVARSLDSTIKELETERAKERDLQFQLLNHEKLAAVGQLVAGIVHNLRNPLNSLVARTKILQRERPELAETLEEILRPAANMEDIITTMLRKTRQEQSPEVKSLDLNAVLTEGIRFLEADAFFKYHVTRKLELSETLPKIQGVYSDFSQSFGNIIKNALDAMRESPEKVLTVRSDHDRDFVYVTLADTGHGMTTAVRERLFQPFHSTKPLAESTGPGGLGGTGLGLYMVSTLLKRYGAEILIKSEQHKGTSVLVKVPLERNTPKGSSAETRSFGK